MGAQGEIGKVMVFINPHWRGVPTEDGLMADEEAINEGGTSINFIEKVKQTLASLGLFIENGIVKVKELFADRITTKELCVEDVCINKAQLKELLDKNQIITNIVPPTPVCDSGHLDLCTTQADCENASGYWYDDICNAQPKDTDGDGTGSDPNGCEIQGECQIPSQTGTP